MSLKLNMNELEKTLELFYTLSGIRIVVFDENYTEITAYPKEKCGFCSVINSEGLFAKECRNCDVSAFERCKDSGEIYIYKCHAGLTEAAIPLKDHNKIIGYMMFGQITDLKDKTALRKFVDEINLSYNISCTPEGIRYRSKKQINAAAQLLEICTNYILLKEMIMPDNNRITRLAKKYIKENLGTELKISDICEYADTSRTKLYEAFKADCGMGVAEYIRKKRLEYAHGLLKSGELQIAEVSEKAGFSDYNYFSRLYKKYYGISPYKKSHPKAL